MSEAMTIVGNGSVRVGAMGTDRSGTEARSACCMPTESLGFSPME